MSASDAAVLVRNGCKSYGRGKNANMVLNNLNMNVPKGAIYGLLGSSGCGKTTILSCIAGRFQLDSGDLRVLGGVPGTKGSGVPGPRLGYMPQEVALVSEMNVRNVIYYFGWLFGMSSSQIAERYEFLAKLLELPPGSRLIKNLSGGQQRRVSFAAALVQTPELLILDEPTVGLDPLLRQSIWDYLVRISRDYNMTIIITTHYIEEAMQAHKIGLLREGKLLAETGPEVLISQYRCSTLEEVFLILSKEQRDGDGTEICTSSPRPITDAEIQASTGVQMVVEEEVFEETGPRRVSFNGKSVVFDELSHGKCLLPFVRPISTQQSRMKALLYKDFLAILRNRAGMLFTFFFPVTQVIICFLAIGNEPTGLHLGVVNDEIANCNDIVNDFRLNSDAKNRSCDFYGLSCLFLDKLNDDTSTSIYYSDRDSAFAATKQLITRGTLQIPQNFSQVLEKRLTDGRDASNETLDNSEIKVWMDMADFLIGYKLQKNIYEKFAEVVEDFADNCESIHRRFVKTPVLFNKPIYDSREGRAFRDFMAPGVIITIVFYLSAMATTTVITSERDSGVWNRNLIAGVSASETITSHILCQVIGMMIQTIEVILISFLAFDLQYNGSWLTGMSLIFLQSFAGIIYGLVVGAFSNNITTAMYVVVGSFLPYVITSGTLWPLQAAPSLFQFASLCAPGTWSIRALLNIMSKGWNLSHPQVYPGFLVTVAWIVIPFIASVMKLRR